MRSRCPPIRGGGQRLWRRSCRRAQCESPARARRPPSLRPSALQRPARPPTIFLVVSSDVEGGIFECTKIKWMNGLALFLICCLWSSSKQTWRTCRFWSMIQLSRSFDRKGSPFLMSEAANLIPIWARLYPPPRFKWLTSSQTLWPKFVIKVWDVHHHSIVVPSKEKKREFLFCQKAEWALCCVPLSNWIDPSTLDLLDLIVCKLFVILEMLGSSADLSSMEGMVYDSSGTNGSASGGGGGSTSQQQQQQQQQRTKRMRTSFKHHQLRTMKSYFAINQNPDAKDLKQLAQKTGLSKRVLQVCCRAFVWSKRSKRFNFPCLFPFFNDLFVDSADEIEQVWFQNARAKWRRNIMRQQDGGGGGGGVGGGGGGAGGTSSIKDGDLLTASASSSQQQQQQLEQQQQQQQQHPHHHHHHQQGQQQHPGQQQQQQHRVSASLGELTPPGSAGGMTHSSAVSNEDASSNLVFSDLYW